MCAGWRDGRRLLNIPLRPRRRWLLSSLCRKHGPAARALDWRVIAGVGNRRGNLRDRVTRLSPCRRSGSWRRAIPTTIPIRFRSCSSREYLGLTYPHPDRLLKLLFGCARGLLLRIARCCWRLPLGLWAMCKEKTHRAAGVTAVCDRFVLLPVQRVVSNWWKAGLTFGPTLRGPHAIPLLCVGLATAVDAHDTGLATD